MSEPRRPLLGRPALETSKAARTSLQPARSYEIPGGPYAKDLGTIDVLKLAEIERGGEYDNVR